MNDFEPNNEQPNFAEEPTPSTGFESWSSPFPYREVIEKPQKERKPFWSKPWFLCVTSALLSAILCFTSVAFYLRWTSLLNRSSNLNNTSTPSYLEGQTPPTALQTNQDSLTTAQIAEMVSPSVVGIVTTIEGYAFFYGDNSSAQNSGSGIIISADGYILTNNHVISDASSVQVTLNNGDSYEATLVGTDPDTDLAILKIEATGLSPAVLGDSDALMVGERAIAIGNPISMDLAGTVTEGIISALNRSIIVDGVTYHLLQTDAAINNGNSGGALVNQYGHVVGINSVKIFSEGVEGLGFAIPINDAKPIIDDLMNYGYVTGRPFIGVSLRELTKELAYYNNLLVSEGLYVVEVTEGAAADLAGIERGDIIIACNGTKVTTVSELNQIRDEHAVGDEITLSIIRNGKKMDIPLILVEKKSTFIPD